MAEERKTTESSEMRNVQLSDSTKEFLVAHRMVQEAGDHVMVLLEKLWDHSNKVDEATEPLWEAVGQLQGEILHLMTNVISEKMDRLIVTDI